MSAAFKTQLPYLDVPHDVLVPTLPVVPIGIELIDEFTRHNT